MASATATKGSFSVTAHVGDGKTLLAFNCSSQSAIKNLAGFTIECQPKGRVHIAGTAHQGLQPFVGPYTYVVTPRYFDGKQSLEPLDSSLSASVTVNVGPFAKGNLELGFTRGFVQSQAFAHHFGPALGRRILFASGSTSAE